MEILEVNDLTSSFVFINVIGVTLRWLLPKIATWSCFELSIDMQMARRVPELISWLLIVGIIALIVFSNIRQPIDANENQLRDAQLTLGGKEAIGMKTIQQTLQVQAGPAATRNWKDINDRLIASMESHDATPEQSFRVAVIAGEIQDKDRALARLDTLSRNTISSELIEDIAVMRKIYAEGVETLDDVARKRLIEHHDFFAHVALMYGLPSSVEPRKSIEQSATSMLMLLSIVAGSLLLIGAVSIALFVTAIVLARKGKIRRAFQPNPIPTSAFVEAFALYLVLFIVFGILARQFGFLNLNWNWLALVIIPIASLWTMRRGMTAEEVRNGLGWHQGQGWYREIAAGLAGYGAGLVFIGVGLIITFILIKFTGAAPQHPITQMLRGSGWNVLGLYGIACVFAPLLEETMFRGALFYYMRQRSPWPVSALVVAVIFAIIHPQGWTALPALASIAFVLAALREWRGSIIAPMTAHACNNFIVLTLALLLLR